MKNLVWMSSRDHPTWYQTVVSAAQWLGFDAPQVSTAFGPIFFQSIADPRFRTDLYMMNLETRAVRRLTSDDSVIPEFHFDRRGKRILWTETGKTIGGGPVGPTRIGTFRRAGTRATLAPLVQLPLPESAFRAAVAPLVPPEVIVGLPLAIDALDRIAHRLQGIAVGGTCCTGSPSGAFVGP